MKKFLISIGIVSLLIPSAVWAQGCVVCTRTADGLQTHSAAGLNKGIVYLAAIPMIFMVTVAIIWWKRNKAASQ